ncbi:MAG: hypothetical protein H7Z16_14465 [Pyrinomonadaceae bacterium]|nr:hypothetical protein [Pyrinomonadaceae bacterium]
MDRLEQSLRRFLNTPIRERRERRITAAKVGAYVKALKERDNAKDALAATPEDSEAQEILRKAQEVLDRVRDDLKR